MAQRFEGKNIDEALTSAAESFGVERYRLLYHVVLEKRGFLGGMKRVVIEAEVNDQASEQVPQAQTPASPVSASSPSRRRERGGGDGGGAVAPQREGRRGGRGRGERGGRGRERDRGQSRQSRPQD